MAVDDCEEGITENSQPDTGGGMDDTVRGAAQETTEFVDLVLCVLGRSVSDTLRSHAAKCMTSLLQGLPGRLRRRKRQVETRYDVDSPKQKSLKKGGKVRGKEAANGGVGGGRGEGRISQTMRLNSAQGADTTRVTNRETKPCTAESAGSGVSRVSTVSAKDEGFRGWSAGARGGGTEEAVAEILLFRSKAAKGGTLRGGGGGGGGVGGGSSSSSGGGGGRGGENSPPSTSSASITAFPRRHPKTTMRVLSDIAASQALELLGGVMGGGERGEANVALEAMLCCVMQRSAPAALCTLFAMASLGVAKGTPTAGNKL